MTRGASEAVEASRPTAPTPPSTPSPPGTPTPPDTQNPPDAPSHRRPRAIDHLALAAVFAAALLALHTTRAHYDARDRDRALLIVETTRFGPGNFGRVERWLGETAPGARHRWQAHPPALFADTVRVDLYITAPGDPPDAAARYPLDVDLANRRIDPATPAAAALIEQIATWAATK